MTLLEILLDSYKEWPFEEDVLYVTQVSSGSYAYIDGMKANGRSIRLPHLFKLASDYKTAKVTKSEFMLAKVRQIWAWARLTDENKATKIITNIRNHIPDSVSYLPQYYEKLENKPMKKKQWDYEFNISSPVALDFKELIREVEEQKVPYAFVRIRGERGTEDNLFIFSHRLWTKYCETVSYIDDHLTVVEDQVMGTLVKSPASAFEAIKDLIQAPWPDDLKETTTVQVKFCEK